MSPRSNESGGETLRHRSNWLIVAHPARVNVKVAAPAGFRPNRYWFLNCGARFSTKADMPSL